MATSQGEPSIGSEETVNLIGIVAEEMNPCEYDGTQECTEPVALDLAPAVIHVLTRIRERETGFTTKR